MGPGAPIEEGQAGAKVRRAVFLDTSAWIAAAIHGQAKHDRAKAAYIAAVRQGLRIVTTPMVLGEAHALFLRLLGRDHATRALESALSDPTHVVISVDDSLTRAAVEGWIKPYRDQQFSLCDAVSFEVMQREGITRALAIDAHFVTAGFEIVS